MKNLVALNPPPTHHHYYTQIVSNKNNIVKSQPNAKKIRLTSLSTAISGHYDNYSQRFLANDLEKIPASTYLDLEKSALISAYLDGGAALDGLKTFIKAAQPDDLQGTCQYCGISAPKTIDHYLPKETYPEYAVLSINLIPCCSECNGYKLDYWVDNGRRAIINFYIDKFFDKRFLYVSVSANNGILMTNFFLDNTSGILDPEFRLIQAHFKRLHLLKRYQSQANDFITSTIDSVESNTSVTDTKTIGENLKENASRMSNRYGGNHWRAVLLAELASTEVFLSQLSINIANRLSRTA